MDIAYFNAFLSPSVLHSHASVILFHFPNTDPFFVKKYDYSPTKLDRLYCGCCFYEVYLSFSYPCPGGMCPHNTQEAI